MRVSRCGYGLAALSLCLAPARAQRDLRDIPDPDPALELARLHVAEGFEINLFASDPDIAKPIQMNWDARGRLWVATSNVYPQLEPGEVANDRIVILEDSDADGVADRSTVFADGLLIPTGVLPARHGAFVAHSTELLFLEDSDGDDHADRRQVVFSGFGTEDTHHILHMLRYGPGGYVYFNQSIYIHSNIETPWGPRRLDAGGIWRFRPETLELEVWARGFVNPWGHRFDDWGQEFVTDGAYGEGINYVFPGATFCTAAGAERILRGLSPGQPKHCGLCILSGSHLPEELRGSVLANDFRGNRINRFALEESGSGFAARQLSDFVWSDHVAFRPVDVSIGPDGALYIADWYNPIIQHGEVDFRDPRRDRIHGRIWRVSAKGRAPLQKPQLFGAEPRELARALGSPERWTREAARQLVGERGRAQMEPALRELMAQLEPSQPDFERLRLELLWALQSLSVVDAPWLAAVLASPDARARAAAVRVLADWAPSLSDVRARLSAAIADAHPRVRLEAVNGLRRLADADAARRALAALAQPLDENLDFARWLTCRELSPAWLPEVARDPGFLGSVDRLVFALEASGSAGSLAAAVALWKSDALSAADRAALAGLFGRFGASAELDLLASAQTLSDASTRAAALPALLQAARQRQLAPRDTGGIAGCIEDGEESSRAVAAELLGLYRTEDGPAHLARVASDSKTSAIVRRAALSGLASDARPAAAAALEQLGAAPHALALRAQATAARARLDSQAAARAAVAILSEADAQAVASELTAAFLALVDGPASLAQALDGARLPEPVAAAALRALGGSKPETEALAQALRTSAQLAPLSLELTPAELATMLAEVESSGDAQRGEEVFRREALQCTRCHAIGGAGGLVGPELGSIGGSAQRDYLIESLLQPDRKIKEGYHATNLLLTDGTIVTGVQLRRSEQELVLRDANGLELVVYADEIEEEALSTVSLMPTGLVAELERADFVDLVAFLARLGKDADFRVGPERFVRSWRTLDVTPEISGRLRARGVQAAAREPEAFAWREVLSRVSGELPVPELPAADFFAGQRFRLLRFGIEARAAGPALLRLSSAEGIELFLNGEPHAASASTRLELPAGTSALTLILEEGRCEAETLSVELLDAPGSGARAELTTQY